MNPHARIAKLQRKVLSFGFIAILGLTTGSGVMQAFLHAQNKDQIAAATNRAHFWRVIAGEEAPNTPTVDNSLAVDLKERLGPHDRNATELPDEIRDFRGSSNTYGGITDAIGRDPFDNAGLQCEECGPLDQDVQQKLLDIKKGNVDRLIERDTPTLDTSYTFTPAGMPFLEYGALLWLVGGPMSLGVALGRAESEARRYGHMDLDWRLKGDAEDAAKIQVQLIALPVFLIHRPLATVRRRQFEKRVRDTYPECAELMDDVDNMLDRISLSHGDDARVVAVQAARDELQHELELLTRSKDAGDLDAYVQKMEVRVNAIKESLASRQNTLKELENL